MVRRTRRSVRSRREVTDDGSSERYRTRRCNVHRRAGTRVATCQTRQQRFFFTQFVSRRLAFGAAVSGARAAEMDVASERLGRLSLRDGRGGGARSDAAPSDDAWNRRKASSSSRSPAGAESSTSATRCRGCGSRISGKYLVAPNGASYHPDCLACELCARARAEFRLGQDPARSPVLRVVPRRAFRRDVRSMPRAPPRVHPLRPRRQVARRLLPMLHLRRASRLHLRRARRRRGVQALPPRARRRAVRRVRRGDRRRVSPCARTQVPPRVFPLRRMPRGRLHLLPHPRRSPVVSRVPRRGPRRALRVRMRPRRRGLDRLRPRQKIPRRTLPMRRVSRRLRERFLRARGVPRGWREGHGRVRRVLRREPRGEVRGVRDSVGELPILPNDGSRRADVRSRARAPRAPCATTAGDAFPSDGAAAPPCRPRRARRTARRASGGEAIVGQCESCARAQPCSTTPPPLG